MITKKSFCRLCPACCGILVDVDAERVVQVRGDRDNPMSRGYTCVKGRQLPYEVHCSARLGSSLKRGPSGEFTPIASEQAMDEIAARLAEIIQRYGPRAVASYSGTAAYANAATLPAVKAWHRGIGSPMICSSVTIDQPAKIIAVGRHGFWGGGPHSFATADVIMLIGINTPVSALHQMGGPPGFFPRSLHDARERGLKVICVDPRRTETARLADIHLQVRPGEDPTLLAGMLRVIFDEGLFDAEFCAQHVEGLEEFRRAVDGFTPPYVERRAAVPADRMIAAARLFAAGPRGCASSGTGPDMAPRPNLTEHLISCLNTVCGRCAREGEAVGVPSILTPLLPRPAQAFPPELLPPEINLDLNTERSRFRGLRQVYGEMPTSALPDEILTPSKGQVRALFVVAGNPLGAWPDRDRTLQALKALDLLVCLDTRMSATARQAHFVIACKHPLEREDLPVFQDRLYEAPYSQFTRAVVAPAGNLLEEWMFFAGLARRMGTVIDLPGGSLNTADPPDTLTFLELSYADAKVPIRTIAQQDGGRVFEGVNVLVSAAIPGLEGRLRLTPDGIVAELGEVLAQPVAEVGRYGNDGRYTHLLICSRLDHVMNSVGHDFPRTLGQRTYNPAGLNPRDLAGLNLTAGELVEIVSEDGAIVAVVEPDENVPPGVVALAHGFAADPAETDDVRRFGSNVNRLTSAAHDHDPIAGMPRMTAIPVQLRSAPHS